MVYHLASKFNLLASNTARNDRMLMIQSNGDKVPAEISEKLFELVWRISDAWTEEDAQGSESLGDFLKMK